VKKPHRYRPVRDRCSLWDPLLSEDHWSIDQEGTLSASCLQDYAKFVSS
jgi:hypothetical protein